MCSHLEELPGPQFPEVSNYYTFRGHLKSQLLLKAIEEQCRKIHYVKCDIFSTHQAAREKIKGKAFYIKDCYLKRDGAFYLSSPILEEGAYHLKVPGTVFVLGLNSEKSVDGNFYVRLAKRIKEKFHNPTNYQSQLQNNKWPLGDDMNENAKAVLEHLLQP